MSEATAVQQHLVRHFRNLHPDLIVFDQTERRFERKRFERTARVGRVRIARADPIAVFDQTDLKAIGRHHGSLVVQSGRQLRVREIGHSRNGETVLARARGHELARLQIHGSPDVQLLHVERNGDVGFHERTAPRHVEISGRRFHVDVADPFLHLCFSLFKIGLFLSIERLV